MRLTALVLVTVLVADSVYGGIVPAAQQHTFLRQPTTDSINLQNKYVLAKFDSVTGYMMSLQADLSGSGLFDSSPNVVSENGFTLIIDDTSCHSYLPSNPTSIKVTGKPGEVQTLSIAGWQSVIPNGAAIQANIEFSLAPTSRYLEVKVNARVIKAGSVMNARLSLSSPTQSVYAHYEDGIQQMMNSDKPMFSSPSALATMYTIGTGSLDIAAADGSDKALWSSTVLYAGAESNGRRTGLDWVLAGHLSTKEAWVSGWEGSTPVNVDTTQTWSFGARLGVNNYDFPVRGIPAEADLATLPDKDVAALLTGVYGSPAGAILGHQFAPHARIAPCVAHPGRCYDGTYNYFDPDSFLSISALLYVSDPYIDSQTRLLIETSQAFICQPKDSLAAAVDGDGGCSPGQVPHHFIDKNLCDQSTQCVCDDKDACVTFMALSGATQSGPNIFWLLSALKYSAVTGDTAWLKARLDTLRLSLSYLLGMYDKDIGLFKAPGSVWVDTFIRANYTSDTNAMMVHVLNEMSDAEDTVGDPKLAQEHRDMAAFVVTAMNAHLWSPDGDHYITQADPAMANGTVHTRDFIDYDANLMAVAFGVAPADRAASTLKRIDSGKCTHARATYVSEIFYGADDCNLGNTGDSAVTMGRNGWVDALARVRMGDAHTANDILLQPLQDDLLKNVWMYERFGCDQKPTHNAYYIEYPEVVAMMMREVRYGINLGVGNVRIAPLPAKPFTWRVGGTSVLYSDQHVEITLPAHTGPQNLVVSGLTPSSTYTLVDSLGKSTVHTDATGTVSGKAVFQALHPVTLSRTSESVTII